LEGRSWGDPGKKKHAAGAKKSMTTPNEVSVGIQEKTREASKCRRRHIRTFPKANEEDKKCKGEGRASIRGKRPEDDVSEKNGGGQTATQAIRVGQDEGKGAVQACAIKKERVIVVEAKRR